MDKTMYDCLFVTEDDGKDMLSVTAEMLDYADCVDIAGAAVNEIDKGLPFIVKLSLIVRRAVLQGYYMAITDVQAIQQAAIEGTLEDEKTERETHNNTIHDGERETRTR